MKKFLLGLAALPFCAGIALAGQPLSNQQMDRITAGFSATSIADAIGQVSSGTALLTTTGSFAKVMAGPTGTPVVSIGCNCIVPGEQSQTLYMSQSSAGSSSVSIQPSVVISP